MFDTQSKRVWVSVGLGILLIAAIASNLLSPSLALRVVIPIIATVLAIWMARVIYHWQREASFARREARRLIDPAEEVKILPATRKPEDYEGVEVVHATEWLFLKQAVTAQGVYFANGILAAILPPLALLLLAFQILVFPSGGGWAAGLISSEMLCLGIFLYFAWTHPEPTADWIENRVRTEILRREQYLIVVGVGPYLSHTPSGAARAAAVRLGRIKGATISDLNHLVLVQEDVTREHWMETLHRGGARALPVRLDLQERIQTYLFQRISKQLLWFANEIRDCRENENIWSVMLKLAAGSAFVVALIHAWSLLNSAGSTEASTPWKLVMTALGVVLPPVGTAMLGIRSMYGFNCRRQLFQRTKRLLLEYKGHMESILSEVREPAFGTAGRSLEEIDLEFRATALRVEQALSFELEQWLLLMNRNEHEVAP